MKTHLIFGFLSLVLFAGFFGNSSGQLSEGPSHVVINEVDINPPGDDSTSVFEWVELYNPTGSTVDLSGWKIGATSGIKKTLTISGGTNLKSGGFAVFSYGPLWFPDVSAVVQLTDNYGNIVDLTPSLSDTENGLKSWQRVTDGYDTDSITDWVFRTANAGSSNGKIGITSSTQFLTITVSSDKNIYSSGEVVKISGQISKTVSLPEQPEVIQQIHLTITGPQNFKKLVSLFPDMINSFKTEMKTDSVLNVPEGTFNVIADYAGQIAQTTFIITKPSTSSLGLESATNLSIKVDKESYLPGETAKLSATASKIVPYSGMNFKIFDPKQKLIYEGSLFPDTQGNFSTTFFINTINPVYGEYRIAATYDNQTVQTSYQVVSEQKEDVLISLSTDKKVYGLDDTVVISGRSNKVWVSTMDIQIVQPYKSKNIVDTFLVKDIVKLEGDGSFKYLFKIPNDQLRLGEYKVKILSEVGIAETSFSVVSNPEQYVATEVKPLSITTDKDSYVAGDQLVILGRVGQIKSYVSQVVLVSITHEDGSPIISKADPKGSAKDKDATYSFTGIPDASGNFVITSPIARNIFSNGKYFLNAVYGNYRASATFEVQNTLSGSNKVTINASTDKEVYGAGETVYLTGGVSTYTAQTSYKISLTDPTGKTTKTGVTINNGQFSWSWQIPTRATIYGLYKLTVSSDSDETSVFFKVSKNPELEEPLQPLVIEIDRDVYHSGDTVKILGNVIKQTSGTEGLIVNQNPEVVVKDQKNVELFRATPDIKPDGSFETSVKLIPGVFKSGQYKISAKYYNEKNQIVFKVDERFIVGGDVPLVLLLETDKEKYLPGDTVQISGRTSKIISVFDVDLKILRNFIPIYHTTLRFDEVGGFHYDYMIPQDATLGTYTAEADTDFDTVDVDYDVVDELPGDIVSTPEEQPTSNPSEPKAKLVDTVNRIPDSLITLPIEKKIVDDKVYAPTMIEGTLRANPGQDSNVNVRVTFEDGTCVIGQEENCLITKSTREDTSVYKNIQVGETDLKVRYSGHGVRLEKFSILPAAKDGTLPEGLWTVEIVKDKQVSRFYYKISYTSSQ